MKFPFDPLENNGKKLCLIRYLSQLVLVWALGLVILSSNFKITNAGAMQNGPYTQYKLGVQYASGKGVARDIKKAVYWFRKAAKQGYPPAEMQLGILYQFGLVPPYKINLKKAIYWLEAASKQGYGQAQYNLGELYFVPLLGLTKPSPQKFELAKKAEFWLKKAADHGNIQAKRDLVVGYQSGLFKGDYLLNKIIFLKKKALNGDAKAQYNLGTLYVEGYKVQDKQIKRKEKGLFWIEQSAKNGFIEAEKDLAGRYAGGAGFPKDLSKSIFWRKKAASQGDPDEQERLGRLYLQGEEIPKDLSKGIFWIIKAARKNDPHALEDLGTFYEYGYYGFEKNFEKSFFWLNKAVKAGQLGDCSDIKFMFSMRRIRSLGNCNNK